MKIKKVLFGLLMLALVFSFFACSKKKTKTITFETNGGSAVATIEAKAGDAITKPQDPTKENLTFGGWFADIDLLEAFTFPEKMPEESITLYAKWVVTLSFDTKGGPSVASIVGEGGKPFTMPADPVREGYVFVGWFTDSEYKNQLTFVMPKVNTTAYAKWQVFETGSSITVPNKFNDNDGVFTLSEEDGGTKITATASKGEWSYCYANIAYPTSKNTTIVVELKGTKDAKVTLKVEGGGKASEETFTMTGENQTCIWSTTSDKLNENAGSMFLVFLNGGNPGCADTPEYVIIKSVKLFRTVDADATQKAAIYFNTNGAAPIEEIYDVPGATVTAPADPERSGYVFAGWFADSEFTTPFVFDKMPSEGALVHAKWEKEQADKEDVDLLTQLPINDNDGYDMELVNHILTVSKHADAGEWAWFGFDAPTDLGGYEYLRVSFMGPKGEQVMFKINDTQEFWVTATGAPQMLELHYEKAFDMTKKALVVFLQPGKNEASGTFEFDAIQFGVKQALYNLLVEGWAPNGGEDAPTKVELKDGVLVLKKNPMDGMEWDCALIRVEDDLSAYEYLIAYVQGTAGEKVLFKIFDSQEYWHTCTGDVDEVTIPITASYSAGRAALVLFANGGDNGTGHEFTFSFLSFLNPVAVSEGKEAVDLITSNADLEPRDSVSAIVVASVAKLTESEWAYAGVRLEDADYTGVNKLLVTVKGTDGETIKFKVNDTREFDVVCDGTDKHVEFDLDLTFDANKLAMVMFANAGVAGTAHEFLISELKYTGGEADIDLMAGEWFSGDEDAYLILKGIKMSKATEGNEWECVLVHSDADLTDYVGVAFLVAGTPGEKVLVKVNDRMETWVTLDDSGFYMGVAAFDGNYDSSKAAVVLFPNAGDKGTGHPFIFYYLMFLPEELEEVKEEVNLAVEGVIETPDTIDAAKAVDIMKFDEGEWRYAGIRLTDPDYTGINKLVVVIEGDVDALFKFKVNDTKEYDVTCTGEKQEVTFDLDLTFDANKLPMVMFADAGKPGVSWFTIYKLQYTDGAGKVIDLMEGEWFEGDNDTYSICKYLVMSKKETGNEWDCVKLFSSEDFTDYTGVKCEIFGTPGEKFLVKVNERMETWVTLNEYGYASPIAQFDGNYDASKPAVVLFPNPGDKGTAHEFRITALIFSSDAE